MKPSKLSPERHVEVARHVALGQPHRVAANLAGIGARTLERYLQRGREAHEVAVAAVKNLHPVLRAAVESLDDEPVPPPAQLEGSGVPIDAVTVDNQGVRAWTPLAMAQGLADPPFSRALLNMLPPSEWPYWRLWRAVKRADAAAEAVYLARIGEAGKGYETVETVEKFDDEGKLVERTTRTKHVKAWQANAWLLQHRFPEHYPRYLRTGEAAPSAPVEGDPSVGSLDDEKAAALEGIDELEEARQRRREAGDTEGDVDVDEVAE